MTTALWLQDLRNSTGALLTSPTTSRRSASRTHMETSRRKTTTSDGGMKGERRRVSFLVELLICGKSNVSPVHVLKIT